MARETDFLDLYKELGLRPDCGLGELKQAYRRRVAVLHPDHPANVGNPPGAPLAAARLQRLTSLYGAAMAFERQHGRLPGAAVVRPPSARLGPLGDGSRAYREMPAASPQRARRWRWWLLVVLIAGVGIWLLWDVEPTSSPSTATQGQVAPADGSDAYAPVASMLKLGMSERAVRAIEGEPLMISGDRWEYGPSWIRFANDKVIDWYSSPLRPLKLAVTRPASAYQ